MADRTEQDLIALETRFWQSMIDNDNDVATGMLAEPAAMVSPYGKMQFDHAGYRKMAEQGDYKLETFELSNISVLQPTEDVGIITYEVKHTATVKGQAMTSHDADSSTWVKRDGKWLCAIHTEAPLQKGPANA